MQPIRELSEDKAIEQALRVLQEGDIFITRQDIDGFFWCQLCDADLKTQGNLINRWVVTETVSDHGRVLVAREPLKFVSRK